MCNKKVNQIYLNCSLILFMCTILPFNCVRSKEEDDDDGNNIIVLGSGGQLTASRYLPHKSSKSGNTIIIVGTGESRSNSGQPANSNVNPIFTPTASPSSPLYQDHHYKPSTLSQRFIHKPLSKNLVSSLWDKRKSIKLDELNKCKKSVNCRPTLAGFIPIMIPYAKSRSRASSKTTSTSSNNQKAQESRLAFQKIPPGKSNPNEPQIIIRKTKSSPPIVIEEVKESDNVYVNYHITSKPVSNQTPSTSRSSEFPVETIDSLPEISPPSLFNSVNSKNGDQSIASIPMESSKMYSYSGFQNLDGFSDKPSEASTNKLIRSIDTLSNSIKAMKHKNIDIDSLLGHRSLSVPLTDQTISTYSYISPTQTMSQDLPTLTNIKENDDEEHGIYGEEIFSPFSQLNGVPTIDLASLSSDEHYPNLLMDGQDGLDDRNDPMNQIFSRGSLLENGLNDPFDPKELSFGGDRMGNMNLDLLLSGKPNLEGRNLNHKWLGPDLNEKTVTIPVHFPIPYHYHHHHNHHNHHTHHGHSSHHKPDHWTHRNDYLPLHSKWHYPQHYIHPSMLWI